MTTSKQKRMSMLNSLANAAPPPAQAGSMIASNRALRAARDAVDGHQVWDLDPDSIIDDRIADRLDPEDVLDLRDAIEANGQTVPILVRRDPTNADRYLLVYGRRRLEAIRQSDKVPKIRALVAALDDDAAMRAQISENMARRDLSYIEKALFARELLDADFGTQTQIADVLTVTKSAISMALSIVDRIGPDLAATIGACHGIGRPKWEKLAQAMEGQEHRRAELIDIADRTHGMALVEGQTAPEPLDASQLAFDAVLAAAAPPAPKIKLKAPAKPKPRLVKLDRQTRGRVARAGKSLRLEIENGDFADWLEAHADTVLRDIHTRWKSGDE